MNTLSNEDLLELFQQQGVEEAFTIIYHRLHPKLYHLALRIVKSHSDAMDAVQNTFIRLSMSDIKPTESLQSLAFRTVQNYALMILRKSKTREAYSLDRIPGEENNWELYESVSEYLDEKDSSPIPFHKGMGAREWLFNNERYEEIQQAMPLLSNSQREAIAHRYLDRMKPLEGAQAMGISKRQFNQFLADGLIKLRELVVK